MLVLITSSSTCNSFSISQYYYINPTFLFTLEMASTIAILCR